MKSIIYPLSIILAAIFTTSCNRENLHQFKIYVDQFKTPKTYAIPSDNYEFICWSDGDQVRINDDVYTVSVTPQLEGSDYPYQASIYAENAVSYDGIYYAAYPADKVMIYNSGSLTISFPENETYQEISSGAGAGLQVLSAPMIARTSNATLHFHNCCALLKIGFAGGQNCQDLRIDEIVVSCDKNISGTANASWVDGQWSIGYGNLTNADTTKVLSFGAGGLPITTSSKSFYLPMPAIDNIQTFCLTVRCHENGNAHEYYMRKDGTTNLAEGTLYDFGTLTYQPSNHSLADGQITYHEVIGTEGNPYLIANSNDWTNIAMSHSLDHAYFRVIGDFSINNPIPEFNGVLDGNNRTITLSKSSLIMHLNGGVVKNLNTSTGSDLEIKAVSCQRDGSKNYFGAIACKCSGANIIRCKHNGDLKIKNNSDIFRVGGLCGWMTSHSTIDKCSYSGNIYNNSSARAGGIAAYMEGGSILLNCYSTGSITLEYPGGLASNIADGYVRNCYSLMNLYGSHGGGCTSTLASGTVQNCYYYGNQTGSSFGGICREIQAGAVASYCYCKSGYPFKYEGDGTATQCNTLTSKTSLTGGATLVSTLNSNIATLSIDGAASWVVSSGEVKLSF